MALPTCACVRGLPPYDRLTAIYQAAAELSGDDTLPDSLCVAGVPPFQRFSYIYAAFRVIAGDDTLPSQECIEGESPADQVSRIYQAVAIYAADDTLLTYDCVRGLPMWQQWVEIYRALYVAAGSPDDLTDPLCVNTTFGVLSEVFCALVAGCTIPTVLSAATDITGDFLTVVFSGPVTGQTGLTLLNANAPDITYVSGEGTDTYIFSVAPQVTEVDVNTLDYAPGDIANGDCPLAAFSDFSVTNNVGVFFVYLRPGGVDTYLRPGGVDTYIRP